MLLTKLLDIFSYFDLVRQFNVFKSFCLSENNVHIIEKGRKINIADISFMKNIRECVDNNNFRIFGKMKVPSDLRLRFTLPYIPAPHTGQRRRPERICS